MVDLKRLIAFLIIAILVCLLGWMGIDCTQKNNMLISEKIPNLINQNTEYENMINTLMQTKDSYKALYETMMETYDDRVTEIEKEYNDKYLESVEEHYSMIDKYMGEYDEKLEQAKKDIRNKYEINCESYRICALENKDLDFSLGGIYKEDDFYCVNVKGHTPEEIQATEYHEACHELVSYDWNHFCSRR